MDAGLRHPRQSGTRLQRAVRHGYRASLLIALHGTTRLPWLVAVGAIVAAAAICPTPSQAQDSSRTLLRIGPAASFGRGTLNTAIPVFAGGGTVCTSSFGGGTTNSLWLGAELQIPALIGRDLGILLRPAFATASTRLTAPPTAEQLFYDEPTRTLINIPREYRLDARLSSITLDVLAHYELPFGVAFAAGPSAGFRLAPSIAVTDNILAGDRSFADGERTVPVAGAVAPTPRRFVLEGVAALSMAIRLRGGLSVVPTVSYRRDLTQVMQDADWRHAVFSGGVALLFDIPARRPLPPPPADTPVVRDTTRRPDTPKAAPRFAAALSMVGTDAANRSTDAAVISVREVVVRNNIPLLPALFFARGTDSLAQRYRRLSPDEARSFDYASLAELDAAAMSHEAMNVIGSRASQNRLLRITIHGSAAGDEPAGLAQARADRVKEYLVKTWGIPSGRITARTGPGPLPRSDETTDDGRDENRRVVISASSAALLAPIITEGIIRDFNPPLVRLTPTIEAEAGVLDWEITIREGNNRLAGFSKRDVDAGNSGLTWQLNDNSLDSTSGRLVAELRAVDSAGQIRLARDSIALILVHDSSVIDRQLEHRGQTERLLFSLVGFGYRSATGDATHDNQLAAMARLVHGDARVRITGYTDRIGDDSFNTELSHARAQYVADRLKALLTGRDYTGVRFDVSGAGVDTDRFPNDLPEGRMLTRGATIMIEQQASTAPR